MKQCQPFNENNIVHMIGKFTFIKVNGVETIAVSYLIYFEHIFNLIIIIINLISFIIFTFISWYYQAHIHLNGMKVEI